LCEPFYVADSSRGGRPGIDPEVYFKMLMVGFFENLPSERGIAARCADSLSIREFLHYGLAEATPHHSSLGIRTVVTDPQVKRRLDKLSESDLAALAAAKRAVQSPLGRQLARDRAEKVERSFEHILDCGGARQTTLRGRENIRKRYLIQAACANLSLLMRHLVGVGTPKQALAVPYALVMALHSSIWALACSMAALKMAKIKIRRSQAVPPETWAGSTQARRSPPPRFAGWASSTVS
jgi:hypothetical protein